MTVGVMKINRESKRIENSKAINGCYFVYTGRGHLA